MQRLVSGMDISREVEQLSKEGWKVVPGTITLGNKCYASSDKRLGDNNGLIWESRIVLIMEKEV